MALQFASKDRIVRANASRYIVGRTHDEQSPFDRSNEENMEWMGTWGERVRSTIVVIGGKWKPLIIDVLKAGNLRSGVLLRKIPQASRKVLTAQLRALEREKIVSRLVFGQKSEHVEYSLTPYGWTLVPVLTAMARWGAIHLKGKEKNRSAGTAQTAPVDRPACQ
jgi:DNA-binding HxlR family transcriptional regulator